MDPFEQIPLHLLLDLLKEVPDLLSLHHLLHASPAISAVFNDYGVEITGAVLTASMSLPIRHLILAVARIKCNTYTKKDVEELLTLFGDDGFGGERWESMPLLSSTVPRNSAPAMREILVLACHIQHLAEQCIELWMQRIQSANLQCLEDPWFKYNLRTSRAPQAYDQHPAGKPYKAPHPGPPTLVERHKVMESMWHIQLLFELQEAARQQRISDWGENYVQRLASLSVVDFWQVLDSRNKCQPLISVVEALESLYNGFSNPLLSPFPRYNGLKRYAWPTRGGSDVWQHSHKDDCRLFFESRGQFYWGFFFKRPSPLTAIPFDPFRRYGFAFWGRDTMATMGFDSEESVTPNDLSHLFKSKSERKRPMGFEFHFRWRSLLTEADERWFAEIRPALYEAWFEWWNRSRGFHVDG
ncbi:hypothetical protein ASPZODRAFT_147746 [Penicilliopsis zonata CBS 506.65]|uniref:F-box domain-containing protein n=1 Tax=Penicilliopsis zonata CBS 506.65 TaxID=1073090 RepID=A0A1L9S4M2_9EURO|nr:hypothetical protein ASPZODRAFT_147746 [Penicilliopsis zonata CBS 506.65]OJJ42120.1 hypothetical protein ASPZODRAFT_147746 [Penicilliopsis zonata CBS 506.65]